MKRLLERLYESIGKGGIGPQIFLWNMGLKVYGEELYIPNPVQI